MIYKAFWEPCSNKVMQVCTSMAAPWNVMEQLEKWLRVLQVFFATSCFLNAISIHINIILKIIIHINIILKIKIPSKMEVASPP